MKTIRLNRAGGFVAVVSNPLHTDAVSGGLSRESPAIEEILAGAMPPALEQTAAQAAYDWPHVATRCVRLVEGLLGGGRAGG